MPGNAPFLSAERLQAMLSPAEALSAIQTFFRTHGPADVAVPPRIHLPFPGRSTIGLYMPAATGTHSGVKIVHLMPDRYPSVAAEVFLYDAETGALLFWGDGKPLTGLRTAGVSCAAALQLRGKCDNLLVFGAGVQAAAHIRLFLAGYGDVGNITVAARGEASFRRMLAMLPPEEAARPRLALPGSAELEAALGAADVVVTTTPAPQPLFAWEALAPTALVVGIGSATHAMNELPPEGFVEAEVWLDTANAVEEAGDLQAAQKAGWRPGSQRGELGDLLRADHATTRDQGGRAIFKSVGHAAQDLAILVHLHGLL